jgi:cell division protein ZapA|tara:strand:- start:10435 stop:10731 length:297 start_codon:yes stop_codon:yes gene_type:complete
MSEGQSIKVSIAGRNYPLTVAANEEEFVRKAASRINDLLLSFQDNFSVKDKQDLLAMAALQITTQSLLKENEMNQKSSGSALQLIEDRLSLILQEHSK